METFSPAFFLFLQHQMFKSYYVVWKLVTNNGNAPVSAQFKSYYVVWKLFFSQKDTERDTGV